MEIRVFDLHRRRPILLRVRDAANRLAASRVAGTRRSERRRWKSKTRIFISSTEKLCPCCGKVGEVRGHKCLGLLRLARTPRAQREVPAQSRVRPLSFARLAPTTWRHSWSPASPRIAAAPPAVPPRRTQQPRVLATMGTHETACLCAAMAASAPPQRACTSRLWLACDHGPC